MRILFWCSVMAVILPGVTSLDAAHTRAELVLNAEAAAPGDTVYAGVRLEMDEDWHTYWRNPGEAGQATSIEWELPEGIRSGDILWPVPEKDVLAGITSYFYSDEVVLLAPLEVSESFPKGEELIVKAHVYWLECKELCVPGDAAVSAELRISDEFKPSYSGLIEEWRARLPSRGEGLDVSSFWFERSGDGAGILAIDCTTETMQIMDFFPYESEGFKVEGATVKEGVDEVPVRLKKDVKSFTDTLPEKVLGILVGRDGNGVGGRGLEVVLEPGSAAGGAAANMYGRTKSGATLTMGLFWYYIGLAFLGGIILNVMPCVLPVIAIKILGFVQESRSNPRRVKMLGLVYGAGVLASFVVLALIVIGIQRAGDLANWGMQMQNPYFLVAITILVTLVALNLFGVFEVNLGGGVMGAAGALTSRHGVSGAFFNGVLATILATPCTAPFLSPALGFALSQPPAMVIATFLAVGLGLALPYVVLSWKPAWLKLLPKPGAWMQRFKIALGFPMLATAIWLLSFSPKVIGDANAFALALFLVFLAFSAWVWGEFVQRNRKKRLVAGVVSIAIVLISGAFFVQSDESAGIQWREWSPAEVEQARTQGHPVLVDFTADWCVTCRFNKITSLEVEEVQRRMRELDVAPFIADYTGRNEAMTRELRKFDRPGVPLVLVYPVDTNKPPIVLPELLTPTLVLDALNAAARNSD
ncbi:MAG: thioredoxin family protein [Verrucomicrobia bacterium]|nr:thioredoxin family protein [Verrucomicrobiota bacterium]MCF7708388.1 thioredoxin family protein [Verrucomicrobiota bacterium]